MRWEYIVGSWRLSCGSEQERTYLAEMGEAGWELLQVIWFPLTEGVIYYWKRPKEAAEEETGSMRQDPRKPACAHGQESTP